MFRRNQMLKVASLVLTGLGFSLFSDQVVAQQGNNNPPKPGAPTPKPAPTNGNKGVVPNPIIVHRPPNPNHSNGNNNNNNGNNNNGNGNGGNNNVVGYGYPPSTYPGVGLPSRQTENRSYGYTSITGSGVLTGPLVMQSAFGGVGGVPGYGGYNSMFPAGFQMNFAYNTMVGLPSTYGLTAGFYPYYPYGFNPYYSGAFPWWLYPSPYGAFPSVGVPGFPGTGGVPVAGPPAAFPKGVLGNGGFGF